MEFKIKNIILAGGILAALSGCTDNPNETKWQYFPDMADSPAFKTQGNYIDPPEGSVARSAILYPESPEEAEKVLQNPFHGQPHEDKRIANGKELFETFCSPCHGLTGKGDGRVSEKGFPRPPDLMLDLYKKRRDGFYFYRITNGSALMPGYGHAIAANERWEITSYIRVLQNATVVPPAPPASTTTPAAPEPAKTDGNNPTSQPTQDGKKQ